MKEPYDKLKSLPSRRTSPARLGLTTWRTALFATTSPTFAHVCAVWRAVVSLDQVACGPTRANVAYLLATPPVIGTWRGANAAVRSQATRRQKHSLFHLSDFFGNDKHGNELRPFWGLSDFRRRLWQDG